MSAWVARALGYGWDRKRCAIVVQDAGSLVHELGMALWPDVERPSYALVGRDL